MRLTLPQQDVYFEQLLFPNDPIYNIGAKILIQGNISYAILNKAYINLINQHDAYRSIIVGDALDIGIEILPEHNSVLGYKDFSKSNNPEKSAHIFMEETFTTSFKIHQKKMLHKFILIKVDESFYFLFSMYHHIITDGWGTSLMFQRLVRNYNEIKEFGEVKTTYPYSYTTFVDNDLEYQNSKEYLEDKTYWKKKFSILPDRLFQKIKSASHTNKSARKTLVIPRSVYGQLEGIAKESRSSTFHVILGILYLYFGRKHANNDLAIGLPVLNRSKSIFKKTVGLFMGVSALRMQLDFSVTFLDLVNNIKQQLRVDYRHQRFPLGKLIQELSLFDKKDQLFNITLSYEKQNYSDHFSGTKTQVIPFTHYAERVALAVYIREFDALDDVNIDFDYNLNYFDERITEQFIGHFEKLISQIIVNPNKKLLNYQYTSNAEEHKILTDFNQTKFEYSQSLTCVNFFNQHVANTPDHIALKDGISEYSYHQLDLLSTQVAAYIYDNFETTGVSPIAVLMDRSAQMIVVLLGILKAGRIYLPLDPDFPEDRLSFIISNSDVKEVFTISDLGDILPKRIRYTKLSEVLNKNLNKEKNTINLSKSKDLAYIIYTSGSTGKPKGVSINHRSLLNFLLSMQKAPGIQTSDTLYSVTTQSFDISILEFLLPLVSGATLYVGDTDTLKDPLRLLDVLKEVKPKIIQGTPSFYQMLFNAGWEGDSNLRVLCGGDLISKALAQKLLEHCGEVWNMYGPTETTIWSSTKKMHAASDHTNIGKPIANTQFFILDNTLQLVPPNFVGTLYIGGDGLAQGYFKNEPLTKEKFVKNPYLSEGSIYNTGDLCKWNTEGEVMFLGRADHQVKIRGYRIELGEIEEVLNQINGIKSSVVVAKKEQDQEAFLVAYVSLKEENFDEKKCIKSLQKELPRYMIPNRVIPLDAFPLTPNKKIDRKLLAQYSIDFLEKDESFKKAETALEHKLDAFYQEILKLQGPINIRDNFFALGGHSLTAVLLINRIAEELHIPISLKTVFNYPTIMSLAKYLAKHEGEKQQYVIPVVESEEYPATSVQYIIWLASQKHTMSIAYNMSSVYEIKGVLHEVQLENAFQTIINKYEILRTNFIEVHGYPHQKIKNKENALFKLDHFRINDSENVNVAMEEYMHQEFNLNEEMLIRIGLFKQSDGKAFLVFSSHHLIMDGWSLEILIKELLANYEMLISSAIIPEVPLNFQFKDYAFWLRSKEIESEEENTRFWKQYLKGYQWKNLIPYDNNLTIDKKENIKYHFVWDQELFLGLKEMVKKTKISLHTVILSSFTLLINRMKGHQDISVGTVNSGRRFIDSSKQIGMFVKTLPLRTKINPDENISDLMLRTHQQLMIIDEHQDIPTEILSQLRLDVLIVVQNPAFDYCSIEVSKELKLESCLQRSDYSRLPLLIELIEGKDQIRGEISFDATKYAKETIEILLMKFRKILKECYSNPTSLVYDIDIALAFEKEKKLDINFNF